MATLREAVVELIAEIDRATKDKWKKHKGQNLFKDTAEKLVAQSLGGQVPAGADQLAEQAATAGAKLLMGSFDMAYEAAVDTIGKWLEQTAGEKSKAILDRVLLMDVVDRVAYAIALKTVLEAVDPEAWKEKGTATWKKVANLFQQLAKDFFEKGLSKKAKKKVKDVKPSDWARKLQEAAVGAAGQVQATNLKEVLKNFETYAKQIQEALKSEGEEEQKAASVRFASLAPSTFKRYLTNMGTDPTKALLTVPPKHWLSFAHTIMSRPRQEDDVWLALATNIELLLGPEAKKHFASSVEVMDGFGVSLAVADKIFKKILAKPEQSLPMVNCQVLKPGDKVELVRDVERSDSILIPAGETGVVSEVSEYLLEVKLDNHFPELDEWENELEWKDDSIYETNEDLKLATTTTKKTEAVAPKSKLAQVIDAGYALPKLRDRDGNLWIPNLQDAATKKAFVKYIKAKGISKEDLALVLSDENNRKAIKFKSKQAMPLRRPPWMKDYPDTNDGALKFARENIRGFDTAKLVSAIPDPQVEYVWLVFNHDRREAYIVYLQDSDFEDANYESALKHKERYDSNW